MTRDGGCSRLWVCRQLRQWGRGEDGVSCRSVGGEWEWTFEVWVICATVHARRFEQLHQALMGNGTLEGEARK